MPFWVLGKLNINLMIEWIVMLGTGVPRKIYFWKEGARWTAGGILT
jgi:hypothetical protein